jgi:hypothetical protein
LKKMCKSLRGCCLKHEWLGNLLMMIATLMFVGTLWFFIEYQQAILSWTKQNQLINPILIGIAVLAEIVLIFFLSLLVFTDCREEADAHQDSYKGRRTVVFPETTAWVDKLGVNPKRNK